MLVAENFYKYLSELSFSKKPKFLLAVSGGPDSMCLAHLFSNQLKFEFSIAHCNYNLRGDESIAEQKLVEEFCKKTKIKFHLRNFSQPDFDNYKNKSIQEVARIMRFEFFNELIQDYHYTHIVTAHHQNDNAETFLFNLIRGSGINGLSGLKEIDGRRVKPLLNYTKEDILEYNKVNEVPYLIDSSNTGIKYSRNKIRNQIIPLLEAINSEAVGHIIESSKHLKRVQSFIEKQANLFKIKFTEESDYFIKINLNELLKTEFTTEILFEIVKEYGFTFNQLEQIIQGIEPGRKIISGDAILYFDNQSITLLKKPIEKIETKIEKLPFTQHSAFGMIQIEEITPPSVFNDEYLYLDYSTIAANKLSLRSIEQGDKFNPLGLKGTQLISNFFINRKISIPFRKASLALVSDEEIAAVIPYSISDKFKISETTTKAIRISIK